MMRSRLAWDVSENRSTTQAVAAERNAIRRQSYRAGRAAVKPASGRVRQANAVGPPQVMHRLLDLPGDNQRVDDGVDAKVPLAPVAPGGPVVRGHRESQQTGDCVDGALYFLLLPTLAKALDRHRVPLPPVAEHSNTSTNLVQSARP